MPDETSSMHKCLDARGNDPSCVECTAKKKDFCNHLVSLLERLSCSKKNNFIDRVDRKAILADAVSDSIAKASRYESPELFGRLFLSIYNKKRANYFRAKGSCYEITERTIAEFSEMHPDIPLVVLGELKVMFGRRYFSRSGFTKALMQAIGEQASQKYEQVIVQYARHAIFTAITETIPNPPPPPTTEYLEDFLRRHRIQEPECIQLLLDLYECFQNGQTQKDLARAYGEKPNTLNQRLRRCRKRLRRMIEEEGWDLHREIFSE